MTVAVEGVGQEVAEEDKHGVGKDDGCVRECAVCVCALTVWTGSGECQTLRG